MSYVDLPSEWPQPTIGKVISKGLSLSLLLALDFATESGVDWKWKKLEVVCWLKRENQDQGYLWNTFTQVSPGFTFRIQYIQGLAKLKRKIVLSIFFMEYWESILQQGSGEVGRVCLFINLYIKLCMRLPFSRAKIIFYEALSITRWVDSTSGSKYCYDPLSNLQRVALSL